jgi:beta-lactamase regulating signal transducer with metallopeptidase domain/tetratricopeptide (TPR) repeat protein
MRTLFYGALSNVAWASILAIAAALVVRFVRRPALAHSLWIVVLLKLVVPGCFALPSLSLGESRPLGRTILANDREPIVLSDSASRVEPPVTPTPLETLIEKSEMPSNPPAHQAWPWEGFWDKYRGADLLMAVWLTGSGIWLVLAFVRVSQFRRLLRYARPAPTVDCDELERLSVRMEVFPRGGLWFLPGAFPPMLWALGGPARILVPEQLFPKLLPAQKASLLAHELAHLKRRDHWVRLLELVVTALYWWCPLVWWIRRELRKAEEECCDAWVVWAMPQGATDYAEALVETTGFLSKVMPALPPAVSGVGYAGELKRRIAMIMRGETPRKISIPARLMMVGLGLMLPLIPVLAQNDPKPPLSQEPGQAEKPLNRADMIEAHYYFEKATEQLKLDQTILKTAKAIAGKEGAPPGILLDAQAAVEKDKASLEAARRRLVSLGAVPPAAPAEGSEDLRAAAKLALSATVVQPRSPVPAPAAEPQPAQAPPPVERLAKKGLAGKIALVDPKRGLVATDLRQRDGVRPGQKLEVRRLGQFIVVIQVTEVEAWGSWAKLEGETKLESIQKGDIVEAIDETPSGPQGEHGFPLSADDHYRLAELHFQKGEFDKAEKECRRALESNGSHLPSRALLDQLIFLQSHAAKAPVPPPSVPTPRIPLIGKVTAVAKEIGLVVISIGKDDGVMEGDEFTVYRGGDFVAKIQIDRADRKWSAGKVVLKKTDPRVADEVSNHIYVSALRAGGNPTLAPVVTPDVQKPNATLRIIERVQPTMVPLMSRAPQDGISPQDWLELVKARLEVQRARVKEAQIALEQARTNLPRTELLVSRGLLTASELDRCKNEVETLSAQLAVKEAEYNEVEVMLVQARRNLTPSPLKPR